jgi:DNA mismatch endonuclease (patch repair protein)
MSPAKRSALMSRIKGKNTGPERTMALVFTDLGLSWETHLRELPGRPDFVFREKRIVVFVDGDFWHGWHFPKWRDKLTEKWELKITQNRIRDRKNYAKLRRRGWKVIRIWEHEIEKDLQGCVSRISRIMKERSA